MKREIYLYNDQKWNKKLDNSLDSNNSLVICFGSSNPKFIESGLNDITNIFKNSIIIGSSSAGEIYQDELYEKSLSVVVIKFEKTKLKLNISKIDNMDQSYDIGCNIANNLAKDDLKSIFILCDGLNINGSRLTRAIAKTVDNNVVVTGGLAADGEKVKNTWVLVDNKIKSNYVTSVGFYGDSFNVAYGSQGGWKEFGKIRITTKTKNNIIYEIDSEPALEVYKRYLGDEAKDLPTSGLLYPLVILDEYSSNIKVRAILSIDEEKHSIGFAADIPQNSKVKFMRASFNQLIDGAKKSTQNISFSKYSNQEAINIAISCAGRKLVLGQKVEEELEAVLDNLGDNVMQVGFYSYGEISPLSNGMCDLQNETMTLTLIWED